MLVAFGWSLRAAGGSRQSRLCFKLRNKAVELVMHPFLSKTGGVFTCAFVLCGPVLRSSRSNPFRIIFHRSSSCNACSRTHNSPPPQHTPHTTQRTENDKTARMKRLLCAGGAGSGSRRLMVLASSSSSASSTSRPAAAAALAATRRVSTSASVPTHPLTRSVSMTCACGGCRCLGHLSRLRTLIPPLPPTPPSSHTCTSPPSYPCSRMHN